MEKRYYKVAEAWAETMEVLPDPGLLLVTADATGKPNVMTIGWALLGNVWSKPILTVFVRPSRYTFEVLDPTGEFTVNVPPPEMADTVDFCGTESGRTHDKFAERGLTAVPGRHVKCPIIDECLLHYECRVVHKNDVIRDTVAADIVSRYYARHDFHRVFFGEILAVYGVPDYKERIQR